MDHQGQVRPRQEALEPLVTARGLAVYGLSLHAAASAYWAWPARDGGSGLVAIALSLAIAVLVAERLAPDAGTVLDSETGRRLRVLAMLAYAGVAALGLMLAGGTGDPAVLRTEVLAFSVLQAAAVLLRGRPIVVANALVLVSLAAFHGGMEAAFAVTGYAGWLVFLLCFDHYLRRLSAFPAFLSGRSSHLSHAFRQAATLAIPVVAALSVVFAVSAPRPFAGLPLGELGRGPLGEELAEAYRRLVLVGLVSGGLVMVLLRWRRQEAEEKPARAEETIDPERGEEEILEKPGGRRKVVYRGHRGRIVRAYLRLLAHAAERRFRLGPGLTATQIAARLREPAVPLATITARFTRARYGPDEPEEGDARAAEAAVEEVLALWRRSTSATPPRRSLSRLSMRRGQGSGREAPS